MSAQRAAQHRQHHAWKTEDSLACPARVLLADDDHELRRLLAAELRKEGLVVTEAGTGFELLERMGDATIRNEAFDLIVTDVRMPGLTGLLIVEGLRNGNKLGSWATPIILITAFGDTETHAEAKRLGAVLLDKPFDLDDFRACATRMVSSAA